MDIGAHDINFLQAMAPVTATLLMQMTPEVCSGVCDWCL